MGAFTLFIVVFLAVTLALLTDKLAQKAFDKFVIWVQVKIRRYNTKRRKKKNRN